MLIAWAKIANVALSILFLVLISAEYIFDLTGLGPFKALLLPLFLSSYLLRFSLEWLQSEDAKARND